MLRCYIDRSQRDWDTYLPLLTAAYRAMLHSSTGFTPNRTMFGREVYLPEDVAINTPGEPIGRDPPTFVAQLEEAITDIQERARQHLKQAQMRQQRSHDLKACMTCYQEGDLVLVKDHWRKKGMSPKLQRTVDRTICSGPKYGPGPLQDPGKEEVVGAAS